MATSTLERTSATDAASARRNAVAVTGPRRWLPLAPLPLRLMMGIGFLYHGAPKIFTSAGHQEFAGMIQSLGVPLPEFAAWMVGLVETIGGLCFLLGAFVTLFAVLNIVDMLVALFLVHLPNGFNFIHIVGTTPDGPVFGMPGFEVNLLYIAALTALLLGGAGAWSLDGRVRRAVPPEPTG